VRSPVVKFSDITLTNSRGTFSDVLGEFVACGVLYHAKNVEKYMDLKKRKQWGIEPMELVSNKHMLIVGYGDIGTSCAKIAKEGFGMKVTGLNTDPTACTEE